MTERSVLEEALHQRLESVIPAITRKGRWPKCLWCRITSHRLVLQESSEFLQVFARCGARVELVNIYDPVKTSILDAQEAR